MGLRPTKTNENAGILRCFRISSLARTFKGAMIGTIFGSTEIPLQAESAADLGIFWRGIWKSISSAGCSRKIK